MSSINSRKSLFIALCSLLVALACVSLSSPAAAGTVTAARSGSWTDGSTWGRGNVPASTDMVAIISGFQVTIPSGKVVTNSGGIMVQDGALINNGTLNSSGELTFLLRSSGCQNNGKLVNTGTMVVDGTKLTNSGTLSNQRSLSIVTSKAMGQLANTSTGVLINNGKLEMLYGLITNDGKLGNAGELVIGDAGERVAAIEGSGAITNEQSGTFVMAGNVDGKGPFVNAGTLKIVGTGAPRQQGFWIRNTFENRGRITLGFALRVDASGTLTNAKEGTITSVDSSLVNFGRVDNYGRIVTGGCALCSVSNQATLNNRCGATIGRVENKPVTSEPCAPAEAGPSTPPPAPVAPPTPPTSTFGTTACSAVRGTTLTSGSEMRPGTAFRSPNGKYELAYQTDGNLVVYELPSRKALWSSRTNGVPALKLVMEADGDVVARKPDSSVAWSTNTRGNDGAVLSLQDDDNLVVYRKNSCQAAWARR